MAKLYFTNDIYVLELPVTQRIVLLTNGIFPDRIICSSGILNFNGSVYVLAQNITQQIINASNGLPPLEISCSIPIIQFMPNIMELIQQYLPQPQPQPEPEPATLPYEELEYTILPYPGPGSLPPITPPAQNIADYYGSPPTQIAPIPQPFMPTPTPQPFIPTPAPAPVPSPSAPSYSGTQGIYASTPYVQYNPLTGQYFSSYQ